MSARLLYIDEAGWNARLQLDPRRAGERLPRSVLTLHRELTDRAEDSNAQALILTGSTARETRTAISDLDYHLVGDRIATDDMPDELDLHVVSAEQLRERLRQGDDFTHWSLRFGLIIFDHGVLRAAVREIDKHQLWPDPNRKRDQAEKSLRTARAMVESGDRDAAIEQVRTALTLIARWYLLERRQFPLSRGELPAQLEQLGASPVAASLTAAIHGTPTLLQLERFVQTARELLDAAPSLSEPSLAHR